MTRSDVVVIGAGPVGLTAALLLADGGADVVLVESATAPSDLPRAISIADETFRTLDRLGLSDALKAESLLDTGSRYYGRGDLLLAESRPVPSRIGHPAKSQFDQPVMEDLLWRRAQDHERIRFLAGTSATAITVDDDGADVDLDAPTGPVRIRATWLVGADGGRSFTRDALGIALVGSTQVERWIVIDLLGTPGEHERFAEFHGNGTRPYVLVPGAAGRLRLEFMLFPDEDPDAMTSPERIRELVRPFHPHVRPDQIRRAAVYIAHQRVARTYRRGRAFLVGDAAHLMPPFSGQGLNAGVRDALNLSWKLLEALDGRATGRLLDSYEHERRTHGTKMVRVSRRTGAVVMATGPVKPRARDLALRLLRAVPSIRAYLTSMRFITPPDYSDGVAVPAGRTADWRLASWIGHGLWQPDVEAADGRVSGLDAHLGSGWTLLALGPGDDAFVGLDRYWDAIGARRVRLLAHGAQRSGATAYLELVCRAGAVARVAKELADLQYVVVRPDRYVAAVFPADDERRVVAALREFVDDRRPSHH